MTKEHEKRMPQDGMKKYAFLIPLEEDDICLTKIEMTSPEWTIGVPNPANK